MRFSSSKDASVRTRQRDMAERDLIFHETFHRDERKHARREVENARWRKEADYFPTHLLAQSKYHKRTKLRGGKTTRPLLSVHYPNVMSPFYTIALPRNALTIDQFLREDNAGTHGNGARPGRSAPRRGAEPADLLSAHRRSDDSGEEREQSRSVAVARASRARDVTAFPPFSPFPPLVTSGNSHFLSRD